MELICVTILKKNIINGRLRTKVLANLPGRLFDAFSQLSCSAAGAGPMQFFVFVVHVVHHRTWRLYDIRLMGKLAAAIARGRSNGMVVTGTTLRLVCTSRVVNEQPGRWYD